MLLSSPCRRPACEWPALLGQQASCMCICGTSDLKNESEADSRHAEFKQ